MAYEFVIASAHPPVLTLTLDRPKVNALSKQLLRELRAAIDTAENDPGVRVIVITGGEGRFFAAGADVPTLVEEREEPIAPGSLLEAGLEAMDAIERCRKPVIAAVNGLALGGGCELALACHLRLAADDAVFGLPEINLGIIPGWGGTHRLPALIGDGRAREWILTGRQVPAQEALEAGMVSRVVPRAELAQAAADLAAQLAAKAPVALRTLLAILRERGHHPDRGADLEAQGFEQVAATSDAAEGLSAFLEKRAAVFVGR